MYMAACQAISFLKNIKWRSCIPNAMLLPGHLVPLVFMTDESVAYHTLKAARCTHILGIKRASNLFEFK